MIFCVDGIISRNSCLAIQNIILSWLKPCHPQYLLSFWLISVEEIHLCTKDKYYDSYTTESENYY